MATALPSFEKFPVFADDSAGIRWKKWIAKFENLLGALDITSDARKKALLLHYCGEDVYDIYDAFSDAQKGVGATTTVGENDVPNEYPTLKQSLENYFNPKQNPAFEVFKFRQSVQLQGESIDTYHTRLRTLAATCEFPNVDKEILMQILHGCTSQRLRRRALRDNFTLEKVLSEARSYELSDKQANEIEKASPSVNFVGTRYRNSPVSANFRGGKNKGKSGNSHTQTPKQQYKKDTKPSHQGGKPSNTPNTHETTNTCRNCGGSFPHRKKCPARGVQCFKCEKYNHYSRMCLSSEKVRQIGDLGEQNSGDFEQHYDMGSATSSDDTDGYVFSVTNVDAGYVTKSPFVETRIFDKPVKFLIDTGATEHYRH